MSFRKLCRSTLIAVYLLIFVGGVVRSSGSGMGCPDWPKCFGQWVPPTSIEQLPENYKEISLAHRQKKNERFVKYLTALGFNETATKIMEDPTVQLEEDFNPVKTWIEYFNRIVGVVIGFLIFAVFISSLKFWKERKSITLIAFLAFVLVGFEGWIGSVVVSTNLTPWVITVHMFLALFIVALLIYLMSGSENKVSTYSPAIFWTTIGAAIAVLIQILFGTQVREAIDLVSNSFPRNSWIANLGAEFLLHRSFSWVVLVVNSVLFLIMFKTEAFKPFSLPLILLILGTVLSGVGMAYAGVPPVLQPIHLVLATATFGIQFYIFLRVRMNNKDIVN
jgi:cytochrome c oxidase assembly protein subunit 15